LKESDIILTNEAWCIGVAFNNSTHKEVISTKGRDMLAVETQKQEFTPIAELKQIETLLDFRT
jgi:hypothetical protein